MVLKMKEFEGKEMEFKLGELLATKEIADTVGLSEEFKENIQAALDKYVVGDWGITSEDGVEINKKAIELNNTSNILAVYETCLGNIFIITEWDRSVTTILFASQY